MGRFMKLIVGLGNPGKKYVGTRHNVGFVVVDEFVKQLKARNYEPEADWKASKKGYLLYRWFDISGERFELVKPMTFMNSSGKSLLYIRKKHPNLGTENLYIVHDDLDILLGKYKIQFGKGPRVHGGLTSIYQSIGSRDFWHVRIGIENRFQKNTNFKHQMTSNSQFSNNQLSKPNRISGEKYVLQRFSNEELVIVNPVVSKVVEQLLVKVLD